jgi:hypothetical protein
MIMSTPNGYDIVSILKANGLIGSTTIQGI